MGLPVSNCGSDGKGFGTVTTGEGTGACSRVLILDGDMGTASGG